MTTNKRDNILFINFASPGYEKAQRLSLWSAKYIGRATKAIGYTDKDLDLCFKKRNEDIFSFKRGAGLWLWKPYIICKALELVDWNDYVFYCDCASIIIRRISNLIKSMDSDIWVSDIPLIEKQWSKDIVISKIGNSDTSISNTCQIQGGFIIVRKTQKSLDIMKKYLELCEDKELIEPAGPDDEKGWCIQGREDQSILSVLLKKEGISPHKDPSQIGKFPEFIIYGARKMNNSKHKLLYHIPEHRNDNYKVVVALHRSGKLELRRIVSSLAYAVLGRKLILGVHPSRKVFFVDDIEKV